MNVGLIRPLTELGALILFFLVPLLNLFRIDLPNLRFFLLGRQFTFNEGYILLLVILTLVFTFVSISQWFGRQFCGWLCPHNTFSGYLIRITKWSWLKSASARKTVDLVLSILFAPIITFCLLAYFMSPWDMWRTLITGDWLTHTGIFFIGGCLMFFLMIYKLRYRFCQHACPYGMLQMILSGGNQKRALKQSMFSGVGLVLLVVMVTLVSLTTYFALKSPGYAISLEKKLDGVVSENKLVYSYDLTVENLKAKPVTYTVRYNGVGTNWQNTLPEQMTLGPNETQTRPLVFRLDKTDIGKSYPIEIIVANENQQEQVRRITLFPVQKP